MPSKRPFKIIIVGGGVAGLTLANMVEKFGLDYVLLEANDKIDPPTGAAIGLMPNGSFILDQLGCYNAIRAAAQDAEIESSHIRASNGKSLCCSHGYPMLFFDRQCFLKLLYDQLEHKDCIYLRSRVSRIEVADGSASVTTKDGSSHTGDIVIGADGIHSIVRQEMRRIADISDPTYFDSGEEDKVVCYYQCSFGIAKHVDGWPESEQGFTTGHGQSFLVVSGPGGRCYWFLFVKLPHVRYGKDIPRYSEVDEAQFVQQHMHLKIRQNLTFGQVYAKRIRSALTPLHEIVYKKWFFGRIFVMGDSAHKPNPIGGMGANAAIETAAEFMNYLLDLRAERQTGLEDLASDEIRAMFSRVQDARSERAAFTVASSHQLQALNAHENPYLATLVWRVFMPLAGDHNFFRGLSATIIGASRLKHLDPPSRPHVLPYDHELPAKPLPALSGRIAWGFFSLGMVALLYTADRAMNITPAELMSWGERGPLHREWLGKTCANEILKMLTSLLSFPLLDSNTAPRVQLIYLLSQLLSPLLIFTIEGYRIGRQGSLLSLPVFFTIGMQVLGICKTAPLFALLSALQPDQNPADRAVPVHVAQSLIPALFLGAVLPTVLMLAPNPDELIWQDWTALWQISPPMFSALTVVLGFLINRWRQFQRNKYPGSALDAERHTEWYSIEDMPALSLAFDFAFAIQAIAHLATLAYTWSRPDLSLSKVFWSCRGPFHEGWNGMAVSEKVFVILKLDLVLSVAAIASYNLYAVWMLRCQGYISTPTAIKAAFATLFGQVIVGSGATWAGLWSWRESVISGLSKSSNSLPRVKEKING
ncbi:FAD/NAD(P)-binding domain-containing protein [Xylaria cf. heliscus]|nr:FAD/NAD(P)-binding domain-containing protein [Xylaria cf. heliscus]